LPALHFPRAFKHESFTLCEENGYGPITLSSHASTQASGDGKSLFINVQFSKNHRPVPIEGANYYLRPSTSGERTPIKIGKDVTMAHTALMRMEGAQLPEQNAV
jgi:hypothetical protein